MVSNVSLTGDDDGATPFRIEKLGVTDDQGAPTARRPDDRLPTRSGSPAPATFKAASPTAGTSSPSSTSAASAGTIDPHYLDQLEAKAIAAYPVDGNYSPRVLRFPPSIPNESGGAKHTISPYNPLNLRLPYSLVHYKVLYEIQSLTRMRGKAGATYLDLVKQYNLAYVDYLRAANGSDEALGRLKALLAKGNILDVAGVQTKHLTIDPQILVYQILGHLCLDVLRSADTEIPTPVRIHALEVAREHFNVAAVATTLSEARPSGLSVKFSEKIYDLIPRRFITNEEEMTKPQAPRFFRNEYVKSIFSGSARNSRPFNLSVIELSSKYPEETIQTLVSILRLDESGSEMRASAFKALTNLTNLDEPLKERIFGENASYRNGGESRIESVTGSGDNLDEVEVAAAKAMDFLRSPNDPAGYFHALCLHPETPDEDVGALAEATYSVLASKYGLDASKPNTHRAAQIAEAYEVLSDPAKLRQYRLTANPGGRSSLA
ncbi:hypothetical protein LJR230_003303 [Trinickia sp. LjRoot230]|uniref:hypothetical protein n=1 Tax=Trinickia sp. LjRoot230 TaxID=3342288 RepID=UPI003ECE3149